jgi:hypothetical protein
VEKGIQETGFLVELSDSTGYGFGLVIRWRWEPDKQK